MNGQETKEVLPIEVWHPNIGNDYVKIFALWQLQRFVGAISDRHKVALWFQR